MTIYKVTQRPIRDWSSKYIHQNLVGLTTQREMTVVLSTRPIHNYDINMLAPSYKNLVYDNYKQYIIIIIMHYAVCLKITKKV